MKNVYEILKELNVKSLVAGRKNYVLDISIPFNRVFIWKMGDAKRKRVTACPLKDFLNGETAFLYFTYKADVEKAVKKLSQHFQKIGWGCVD